MATKNKIALGLVGGMLVGAVAGLMFAPKTGKKTRDVLYSKATQLRNRVKGSEDNVWDSVDDSADHYAKLLG